MRISDKLQYFPIIQDTNFFSSPYETIFIHVTHFMDICNIQTIKSLICVYFPLYQVIPFSLLNFLIPSLLSSTSSEFRFSGAKRQYSSSISFILVLCDRRNLNILL